MLSQLAPKSSWPSSSALISKFSPAFQGLWSPDWPSHANRWNSTELTQHQLWGGTDCLLRGLTPRTSWSRCVELGAGQAAWPRRWQRLPAHFTASGVYSFIWVGKAGGRDHRALEWEEIFVTAHLRERSMEAEGEGPASGHPAGRCKSC